MSKVKGTFRPMMTAEQKAKRKKQEKRSVDIDCVPYYFQQSIQFSAKQLPEIKKWEVGENYQITVKVRMKSFEERKREGEEAVMEGRFEVVAVKADSKLNKKQQDIMDKMV